MKTPLITVLRNLQSEMETNLFESEIHNLPDKEEVLSFIQLPNKWVLDKNLTTFVC
jgi:hypothetical protein